MAGIEPQGGDDIPEFHLDDVDISKLAVLFWFIFGSLMCCSLWAIATFNRYQENVREGYLIVSPLGVFIESERVRSNTAPSSDLISRWNQMSNDSKATWVGSAEARMVCHEKLLIHKFADIIRNKLYKDDDSDESDGSQRLKEASALTLFLTDFMEKSVDDGLFDITNKSAEVLLGEQLVIWENMSAIQKIPYAERARVIMVQYDVDIVDFLLNN